MNNNSQLWKDWHDFFASRRQRRLPSIEDQRVYSEVPDSVARSLAIFQLGESGGGTVVSQARSSRNPAINHDYADALNLFVKEEHRHAEILAICVRNLGGELIRSNWTAKLFVFARRLIGLRLKILVLLAAEVVGICYYQLLASKMPESRLRSLLFHLVDDEKAHLHFHCNFLQLQANSWIKAWIFRAAWRATVFFAGAAVLVDHRNALRDLNIDAAVAWQRWHTVALEAERLVLDRDASGLTECISKDVEVAAEQGAALGPLLADLSGAA